MMNVTLTPSPIGGVIAAPPSKSDAHRRLICAWLSGEKTFIQLPTLSKDLEATLGCLTALGAEVKQTGEGIDLRPGQAAAAAPVLDCGESGSTLRFMLPVAAAVCDGADFCGGGRLPQRPIADLRRVMESRGVAFSAEALPFHISGRLRAGLFQLPGDISSQYISGLLMALPCLPGNSEIRITNPLQSGGYVDMTLAVLKDFGIQIETAPHGWRIPGGQRFHAGVHVSVEGDWSNAAFFLCLGAISAPVTVTGLDRTSAQGDRAIVDLLRKMGACVQVAGDRVTVSPVSLKGREIDVQEIPDLLPVLAVTAACAGGETRFVGAARLRAKESDRLSATAALLSALGGSVEELKSGLIVRGSKLRGGTVDGCNDHRIVMAAAVAAARCQDPVTIQGSEAVAKSFPDFFRRYEALGGKVKEE